VLAATEHADHSVIDDVDPVAAMAVVHRYHGSLVVTALVLAVGDATANGDRSCRRVDRWCRARPLLSRRFRSSALRACGAGRLATEQTRSIELSVGSSRCGADGVKSDAELSTDRLPCGAGLSPKSGNRRLLSASEHPPCRAERNSERDYGALTPGIAVYVASCQVIP
jgi:hypothetical protein